MHPLRILVRRLPCLIGLLAFAGSSCGPALASDTAHGDALRLMLAPQTLRSDSAPLVWHKPPGAVPGLLYQVFHDDKLVGETAQTHHTVAGLAPQSVNVFQIKTRPAPGGADAALVGARLSLRTLARETIVSVRDHGAVGDGRTLDTRALQAAIDACPPGGVVLVPEGTFLSGALFLKSDMTLEIAKGGVLQGSSLPEHYTPFIRNRFEGWEMDTHASLLNAGRLDRDGPANVRNLSIRGQGTISGGGGKLSDAIRKAYPGVEGLRVRGRLILLMNAENVEVSGLTLKDPSGWTLHYIYSENVSLHGLTIRSDVRNGDGIDPDSSKNSYIFDCTFDTGDDCIAIKSGKNPEGNVVNRPTENVRIFDCRFERGHGISIGSEMSGGVRGVLIEDCVAGPLLHGLQIKATPARGGFVEDVLVRDCDLRQITVYTELPYNNDGAAAPAQPFFRRFRFENIDLSKADPKQPAIVLNGFPAEGHRTRDVVFDGIRLPADALVKIDRVENVSFHRMTTADGSAPRYEITRSERVSR